MGQLAPTTTCEPAVAAVTPVIENTSSAGSFTLAGSLYQKLTHTSLRIGFSVPL
jgi:hypothetical protein